MPDPRGRRPRQRQPEPGHPGEGAQPAGGQDLPAPRITPGMQAKRDFKIICFLLDAFGSTDGWPGCAATMHPGHAGENIQQHAARDCYRMYDPKTKGISQTHNVTWTKFTPSEAMDTIYPHSDDGSFADNEDDGEGGDDDSLMTVFSPDLEAGRKEHESDDE